MIYFDAMGFIEFRSKKWHILFDAQCTSLSVSEPRLGGYPELQRKKKMASHLTFELYRLRKSLKFCAPCFATISLMPDSKGHKPKQYDNNSYGVMQQHK